MTRSHAYRSIAYVIAGFTLAYLLIQWLWPAEPLPSLGPEAEQGHVRLDEPAKLPQQIPPSVEAPRSERVAEYHMDVRLDETTRKLYGTQTITWNHPGKKTVNELYFHLYPNAFASPHTTFMKESGGQLRADKMPTNGYGSINITELKTSEGMSLMNRLDYVQPDDNNTKDRTVAKLRLTQPVKAGESITLKMKFEVELPKVFARMGMTDDDFVMAGQWFPKLAAYEEAGVRGRSSEGWNVHQYHGSSEFYSNFGIYNVRIQVPSRYIVASTGFQAKAPVEQDNMRTYQFYADDVHDFAWSASPHFVYAEEPFSSQNVPGVRIKLYLDPKHAELKERYFYAAKAALAKFSEWFGEYPYSTLSIVVPPESGNGAGGMEYPTLVTAFGAQDESPGYDLERTVIHEIGHQYFYGMIASNEFEEAWLDEGFTSYAEDKLMESEFGVPPSLALQASYMTDPAPLKQSAWKYKSQNHYAENVYYRAKLVLFAMEKQVGEKTMLRILKAYTNKYRFKHPTTADFQRVVESVTKQKWTDFFNQYVYGDQMADFAVDHVDMKEVKDANGKSSYQSTVYIQKYGANYPSVPIVFHFEDGTTTRKVWQVDGDRIQYQLKHTSPLEWVMIDPLYSIAVENRHINNYMKVTVEEPVKTRVSWTAVKAIEIISNILGW
ncbi:MAG: M1 family metallopeptidase [Paenibacillus sp.]|uniref:M1 family metallopeptidase n=1 Tax=Paenibacillus aquistagni TaxID=1852522 RepID=UPI000B4FFB4F|nr:M1 family metallopeptidase [Paenibacillus aquistagni]MBR2567628.1 M1 family metallopeptidase [Paenibacillus sp.]